MHQRINWEDVLLWKKLICVTLHSFICTSNHSSIIDYLAYSHLCHKSLIFSEYKSLAMYITKLCFFFDYFFVLFCFCMICIVALCAIILSVLKRREHQHLQSLVPRRCTTACSCYKETCKLWWIIDDDKRIFCNRTRVLCAVINVFVCIEPWNQLSMQLMVNKVENGK